MRLIASTLVLGLLAVTPALAKERLSDGAYIAAARCSGVLGASADPSMKTLLREQSRGRDPYIQERAEDSKRVGQDASRQAAAVAACAKYAKASTSGGEMAAR